MSFSLSGNVITQSGTDTDLSGMAGISGVTTYSTANGSVYVLDGRRLEVTGTLSIEPTNEKLIFLDTCPNQCFKQNGTLTVGSTSIVNGDEVNSASEWLRILVTPTAVFSDAQAGLIMGFSSTTNFYGGTVFTVPSVSVRGTVTTTAQEFVLGTSTASTARLLPSGGSLSNMTLVNNGFKLLGTLDETPVNLKIIDAQVLGVMVDNRSGAPSSLTLEDYEYVANGALTLVADGAKILSNNTDAGTVTEVSHNLTDGGQWQYVEFTSDIDITLEDQSGTALSGAKVVLLDNDNGNRANILGDNAKDFTGDYGLNGSTDVSGNFTGNMLLGVDYADGTESTAVVYQDWRNKSNTKGADDFDLRIAEYGSQLINKEYILQGKGGVVDTIAAIPDVLITESSKSTVDARLTHSSAQEGYDAIKAELIDNYVSETDTIIGRVGDQLVSKSNRDLILDVSAASARSYTASAVTLKPNVTFTGGFDHDGGTGEVTLLNGTLLNGSVFSCCFSSADSGVTYTNVTSPKYVNTAAGATSVTFDGTSIDEVEVTGGGTLTLTLTNGAALPTLTETSGTITVINPMTINIAGDLLSGDRIRLQDATGTQQLYDTATGTTYQTTVDRSFDGTVWRLSVDRAGYSPFLSNITIAEGTTLALDAIMVEYKKAAGGVMYAGTTSANVTVSFDLVTPQATIDIGDASVSPQVIFDEAEDALLTADGMAWHAQQGTIVTHDDLPGVGPILFLQGSWRLRRENSGDVNAGVGGYVVSTDGTPVDGTNGDVSFVGGLTVEQIGETVWDRLTASHGLAGSFGEAVTGTKAKTDQLNFTGSDVQSVASNMRGTDNASTFDNTTDQVTTDTASRNASKADVSSLATSAEIAALNDFDPASDVVAEVTLVQTTTTNTDMRGTDGANTTAPDNTGIAAIQAKTDNLPVDPASETNVDANQTLIEAVKLKTDNLPDNPATEETAQATFNVSV